MGTRKVLLLEDDVTTRRIMKRLLAINGFNVLEACCLKEGFQLAIGNDWALCDLMLPDGNGIELARYCRLTQPETKIGILTATNDPAKIEEVQAFVPEVFYIKPIPVEELLAKLST